MVAFVRVLGLAQPADINNITLKFSDRIVWLLSEIIKNPINPLFNHYFFESLALMIIASSSFPETFNLLEAKIVPHIFAILQSDQSDLFPYAFQLIAAIIDSDSRPEFPDYIKSLIPVILQPTLWTISCNIPGLIRLLQACFIKNPAMFSAPQTIESILSIFRILINSKVNDIHGFTLIISLFGILPSEMIEKYIRPVLLLILARVQSNKTQRLSSYFLLFVCYIVIETRIPNGAEFILRKLEEIQPNIYVMLFKSLFNPILSRIQESSDKKLIIFGVTELLMHLQGLIQGPTDLSALWFSIFAEVLKLSASKISETSVDFAEDISTSPGAFNRLSAVPKFRKYSKIICLPDSDLRVVQFIKSFENIPSFKDQLNVRLDEASKKQLMTLMQKFNTSIWN